ncbi:MAG: polysaccharide deacetylase family protein [Clostridiales bacterium]|nr:polysaccharide deacetylase family protein [Candidatus Blautia equi]
MSKFRHLCLTLIVAFLFLFSFQAQAATPIVKAPASDLKDVRLAEEVPGEWVITDNGFRFKSEETRKYLRSQWLMNEGSIYYLDKKGYRVNSSWILYNNYYYYVTKKGTMLTGWLQNRFYMKANGRRASGITKIGDEYYYFDAKTGKKKTGWITYKKKKYFFDKTTGVKATSKWIKVGSNYRYVDEKGVMLTNCWVAVKGKKYYVNSKGNRVTGEQYINGKWYYFKKNGVYDPTKKLENNVDPRKKMVALTFDDGPSPYTNTLLGYLRASNARATFFMVGSSVGSYRSAVKQMFAQHCELGNHSYSHTALDTLSNSGISSEISRTNAAVKAACGHTPTVARLPYGSGHNNSRVLGALGLPSIYWSIDTRDWANTGNPQSTINAVLGQVQNGDIVLMHDLHSSTVQACKTIIPSLKSRGYQMVTVSELAKYKGKTSLHTGRTYYSFR